MSALTHDPRAAGVILAMVALSTLMRFVQEARSQRAAEALRGRVGNKATVLRRADGRRSRARSDCPSSNWCRATCCGSPPAT